MWREEGRKEGKKERKGIQQYMREIRKVVFGVGVELIECALICT
jgi:hypothetical protein